MLPHRQSKRREKLNVSKLEKMLSIVLNRLLNLRQKRVIQVMNIISQIYHRNLCKIYHNKQINMNKVNLSLNQAQTQNQSLNNLDPKMNQRDQETILNQEVTQNQNLNLKKIQKIKNLQIKKKMLKQKINQFNQLLRKSLKLLQNRLKLKLKLKSLRLLLL